MSIQSKYLDETQRMSDEELKKIRDRITNNKIECYPPTLFDLALHKKIDIENEWAAKVAKNKQKNEIPEVKMECILCGEQGHLYGNCKRKKSP